MKPWLFDILACPIDKFFPLNLYIFSFETKIEEFAEFLETFEKRDLDLIKKYPQILCIIIDNQNRVITQSKSNDYNINLIYDSFEIFYRLKDKIELETILDNESHIFKTDNKIRIVRVSRLNFLKSNLKYLVGISESFNERKLDKLMHNIENRLIDIFKN